MEKLIIPAGCSFEGEITAIAHAGDILITSATVPARIHSEQGMIRLKAIAPVADCEELTAPQGRIELEGETLNIAKIVAAETSLQAGECELGELMLTGHLTIDAHDIVVGTLNAGSASLSGDTIKGDLIEVDGELHLEANLTMVREIHAGRVVIHGSIDCKTLVARDGVVVASGNVAIKRLEAPTFEAEPEVTGIVVLATCKTVKAQGVRGFLHPNELDMLNDAAAGGGGSAVPPRTRLTAVPASEIKTLPLPPEELPIPPEEPAMAAQEPELAPVAVEDDIEYPATANDDKGSLVMDSAFEDDDFDAARAFAEAEAEFEAAPAPSTPDPESAIEIEAVDDLDDYETVLLPQAAEDEAEEAQAPGAADDALAIEDPAPADEPVSSLADEDMEEINTGELMDHFDDIAELEEEEADAAFSVEDVAAEIDPEPVELADQFSEEPSFDAFTEVYDTRDVNEPKLPDWGARRGNSGEFDTVALDPESLRNLSSSFEAMPMPESGPAPDFQVPDELEEPDHLSVPDLSVEVPEGDLEIEPATSDPAAPDFLPGDLDDGDFEVVAEELPTAFELVDAPEELSPDELDDLSGTFDPDELEAISDSFDEEVEDLDDDLSVDDLDDHHYDEAEAEGEDKQAAEAYELDDVALPEIGEIDPYDFAEVDHENDDDPLGEAVQEAFDELEHSMEPDFDEPAEEPALSPEDELMRDLFVVLDQLRSYFEDEYQPINQIQRYLEERRLNLFYKEGNRNAVLGSFDKHNNAQVSQLVRQFFGRLDQFREQHG